MTYDAKLPEREQTPRACEINRAADRAHATFQAEGWTYGEAVPSWGEVRNVIERLVRRVEVGGARLVSSGRILVRNDGLGAVEIALEIGCIERAVPQDDDPDVMVHVAAAHTPEGR